MNKTLPALEFQNAVALQRAGRAAEAEAICIELLKVEPLHFGALHLRGLLALERGDIQEGIDFIARSLAANPHQPAAHSNIGNALFGRRQLLEALSSFDRALQLEPNHVPALYNRANTLRELGRASDAAADYERALALKPDHVDALIQYGALLRVQRRYEEALRIVERVLVLDSNSAAAHHNRAAVLAELGKPDEALAYFNHALALTPTDVQALSGRGTVQLQLRQFEAALDSFTAALQLSANDVSVLINRGNTFRSLQRYQEALCDFERALELTPSSVLVLGNCGNALADLGRFSAALERYAAALTVAPEDPIVLFNQGAAFRALKRPVEAMRCYGEVLRLQPSNDYALNNLWHLRMDHCNWTDYDRLLSANRAALERSHMLYNPMSLLLLDDPALALICTRLRVEESFSATDVVPLSHGSCSNTPLRIAYLSGDFNDHPVSRLLVGVLEHHDRARVEVFGISFTAADSSSFTQRVVRAFDRYIEVGGLADLEVAEVLRDLGIDIAIDLMGWTLGFRLGVFAHGAAPIQASYLGYAGTTGAPYMDYLIADETVIPYGEQGHYAESVVRLPGCFLPIDDRQTIGAIPSRRELGLPELGFVFCAFTQPYKINPPMFSLWMRLLREIDGSVLWLRWLGEPAHANLRREALRHGIQADRLVFAPYLSNKADHLARQSVADLYLDTLPCNAHSTLCDALYAGVPAVTCAGRGFAARVASSALRSVCLPQLVAADLATYFEIAKRLAAEPRELSRVREHLAASRFTAGLFDTAGYTRRLEAAYARMQMRRMCGEEPAAFSVAEPAN